MQNVMIDIESLGTTPGCVVLSIGAVEFDDNNLGKEFEVNIDVESCTRNGLTMDARTVLWWLDQSDEARKAITQRKNVPLEEAMVRLHNAFDWKGKKVWCNGSNFDTPILEEAFRKVELTAPWRYYDVMDYRTLKNLMPTKVLKEIRAEIVGNYTSHNALDDAKEQALTTIGILDFLKG